MYITNFLYLHTDADDDDTNSFTLSEYDKSSKPPTYNQVDVEYTNKNYVANEKL